MGSEFSHGTTSRGMVHKIKRDTVRRDCFRNTIAAPVSRRGREKVEVCGEVNRKLVEVSPLRLGRYCGSSNILFSVVDLTVFALLSLPNRMIFDSLSSRIFLQVRFSSS